MIRVVIAEDDFRVGQLHEKFLENVSDVTVVGKALNGGETLELVEAHQPELLLLDVYMPDRLGTDLLHEIRERAPLVDIIMITAADDKQMVEKALKYGVVDYMIKPITMERFYETLNQYKKTKRLFNHHETFSQSMVDELMGHKAERMNQDANLPKGIDSITLEKVREILNESPQGLTADQAGESIGVSKTTARRYLEYLISIEEGQAEMRYGKVGRPERKYFLTVNQP
ncbi:transcriptional regulator [Pontibacillus halophilus JSM 076056 = DSM 19796]|uniref:Transcriptional regulator n=1 Tax=Pontibacillus halophilus JSM 076056 = DSM 19796 TaxID=1385510 RepID=A0A0A5HWV0_9BACI|nr:response regulator [Pontibacillus halophilus]KGX88102.1 transcriptional regulator [Pontibacillus halophilus JSM 076056 = DSM 19796]